MGQEITKVVITDLVLTVMIIMIIDFLRDLWVRYCAVFWCWNLEEGFVSFERNTEFIQFKHFSLATESSKYLRTSFI